MFLQPEDIIKLVLALLAGGLIGMEREYRSKAAGFRTIIFITLGSAVFTILSLRYGDPREPTRIAAAVVTGVGFIGAGAILQSRHRILGLTTAATIWMAAAVGMVIGVGEYYLSAVILVFMLIVLWVFPKVEKLIDNRRSFRSYMVVCPLDNGIVKEIEHLFDNSGLTVRLLSRDKDGDQMTLRYQSFGHPEKQSRLEQELLDNPNVIRLKQ